jgi:hypothetical protein
MLNNDQLANFRECLHFLMRASNKHMSCGFGFG